MPSMYNLIMDYNYEEWENNTGSGEFYLSRLFEHTADDIKASLLPISNETLESLASYPCLFMSELQKDGLEKYVHLYLGTVSDLEIKGHDLYYRFKISKRLSRFQIDDRESFENALALNVGELNRTHWAVKKKNLEEIGKSLDLNFEISQTKESHETITSNASAESDVGQVTVTETDTVSSVTDFIEQVSKAEKIDNHELFFRGQPKKDWELKPKVFRENYWKAYEANMCLELLSAEPKDFQSDQYMIDKLIRMQHHNLPTRLLDITSNPLVALFFCCHEDKNLDETGEVFIFHIKNEEIKFYDSDTVSCLSNIALLDEAQQDNLLETNEHEKADEAKRKLVGKIKPEKPYFENRIIADDLRKTIVVKGRVSHERISAQSGAFILFGQESSPLDTGTSFPITKIPVENKKAILEELKALNIHKGTLLPSLQETAEYIRGKYEERHKNNNIG